MKSSERGQVTIPRSYRERYGYLPHTEVVFEVQGDALVLKRAQGESVNQLRALYGKHPFERSTDELMALLRNG